MGLEVVVDCHNLGPDAVELSGKGAGSTVLSQDDSTININSDANNSIEASEPILSMLKLLYIGVG